MKYPIKTIKTIKISLGCLLLLYSMAASGQGHCLEKLKQYVKTTSAMGEPPKGKVYYMHYSMDTAPGKKTNVRQHTESKIYRGQHRLYFESEKVQIYQDLKEAFLVLHPLKRIIWHKDREALKQVIPDMGRQQEWILEHSAQQYCRPLNDDKEENPWQAKLTMDETVRKEHGVKALLIDFRKATGEPLKVTTLYEDGHQYLRRTMYYHQVDYDYRHKRIGTARSYVFSKNNTLLPRLQGYELIVLDPEQNP